MREEEIHTTAAYTLILYVFVPLDLVSDMLGSDKYKLSWQTALDSLQDPFINR